MKLSRRHFLKTLFLGALSYLFRFTGKSRAMGNKPLEKPNNWAPAYKQLEDNQEFKSRIEQAYKKLKKCDLCPHRCGVNRIKGETGFCNAPDKVVVYSHQPHFGEELPLVGNNGSGTIFFSNCNLRCVFCQNWPIAHQGKGRQISDRELADIMLNLQQRGCHNINLVTPTHVMPNILRAVRIALHQGLDIPLCYNTGGYELPQNIKLLDGIVDIYLPDLKFMDGEEADKYVFTGAHDYPKKAQSSIKAMHRQVGDLITNDNGVALRGVMVRHLVMPNRVAGTRKFVKWIAENLTKDTYVNIMSQYRVEHQAYEYERIARSINRDEFTEAITWAREAGLRNLDKRSESRLERFRRMFR